MSFSLLLCNYRNAAKKLALEQKKKFFVWRLISPNSLNLDFFFVFSIILPRCRSSHWEIMIHPMKAWKTFPGRPSSVRAFPRWWWNQSLIQPGYIIGSLKLWEFSVELLPTIVLPSGWVCFPFAFNLSFLSFNYRFRLGVRSWLHFAFWNLFSMTRFSRMRRFPMPGPVRDIDAEGRSEWMLLYSEQSSKTKTELSFLKT